MDNKTDCHNATLDVLIEENWIGLGCLGILHLILGIGGLWVNNEVLNELKLVKLSKLVNNLTHYLAWCCKVSSGCQTVIGLRLFYKFFSEGKSGFLEDLDLDQVLVDLLIVLWYFFTMLIHILVAYMGIIRYVFVFKKSIARSMHDTPAYSTLAGNFIVWTCVLCTCSVEATLLDSRLYTFWSGNKTFLNDGFLIPIILHHLIMLTLDFLAFHFYQKINDRLTDKPIDGHISKNTQVDFHNILDLASGKVPNKDTTNSCNDPRVEDDQVDDHRNRHHNFVPWRIHRQVLLCTTVASSILILAFIFISLFCVNRWSFWIFHGILTVQVSLTSLGPALCQLKHFSREKIKRRFVAKQQQCQDEEDLRRKPPSHLSRDHLNPIQPPKMAERREEAEAEDSDRKKKAKPRRASIKQAEDDAAIEEDSDETMMSTTPPALTNNWSDTQKKTLTKISRSKYKRRWQRGKTASLPNIHHIEHERVQGLTNSCSGYIFASILTGQVNRNQENTKKCGSSLWRRKVEKFPTVSVIYKPANSSSIVTTMPSSSRSSSLSPSSTLKTPQTMLWKKAVGEREQFGSYRSTTAAMSSSRELLSAPASASQKRLGRRNMEADVERCQEQREARRMTGNQGLPSID